MEHAQRRPWILIVFGVPALVRGSLALHDQPASGWAVVSLASGVLLTGLFVVSLWLARRNAS